ncbi:MAG: hypothetical protein GWN87_04045 [Desulfuromonadales bacterium]|nr:hypothetical protein [Desulfuromonadales bacterium]NIS39795.1 hypothetical protein [Desulfuromonadales bacterium]
MTVSELKDALTALSPEERKQFILETFPDIAREAMDDPSFAMQLFPLFLSILKEKGIDPQQLVQLAGMMGGSSTNGNGSD